MKINGRLLLLIVVIGLFVRVWKTNEHPRTRPVARSRSEASEVALAPSIAVSDTGLHVMPVANRRERDERSTVEEIWTETNCPIPLPPGLAPGTYRAINDVGRIAKLTIAVEESSAQACGVAGSTELMMTVVNAERWYLIRLRSEPTAARTEIVPHLNPSPQYSVLPEVAPQADDVPVPNRKFDFSGYEDATVPDVKAIERAVIEQASRPSPPEMPSPL